MPAHGTVIPYQAIPDLRVKYASKSKTARVGRAPVAKPIQHNGKWRIRFTDPNGQRGSQVVEHHAVAELALRRLIELQRLEIAHGLRPVPLPRRRFDQLADHWLGSQASDVLGTADAVRMGC